MHWTPVAWQPYFVVVELKKHLPDTVVFEQQLVGCASGHSGHIVVGAGVGAGAVVPPVELCVEGAVVAVQQALFGVAVNCVVSPLTVTGAWVTHVTVATSLEHKLLIRTPVVLSYSAMKQHVVIDSQSAVQEPGDATAPPSYEGMHTPSTGCEQMPLSSMQQNAALVVVPPVELCVEGAVVLPAVVPPVVVSGLHAESHPGPPSVPSSSMLHT